MNQVTPPRLRKAKGVMGKTLVFRDAAIRDAAFILALRTDTRKAKHLSNTPPELDRQIAWLEKYEVATDQVYFIIENMAGVSLGTVRLYDPRGDSFCWGSWILIDGAPLSAAIESALMVYAYALDHLGFKQSHFEVRKDNENVWRFHERFGAKRVLENELEYHYQINFDQISTARQRYKKYLTDPLMVKRRK